MNQNAKKAKRYIFVIFVSYHCLKRKIKLNEWYEEKHLYKFDTETKIINIYPFFHLLSPDVLLLSFTHFLLSTTFSLLFYLLFHFLLTPITSHHLFLFLFLSHLISSHHITSHRPTYVRRGASPPPLFGCLSSASSLRTCIWSSWWAQPRRCSSAVREEEEEEEMING